MKPMNAIVAVLTALALGGCYWTPAGTDSGAISLAVTLPRDVFPDHNGYLLRGWLYNAGDVSGRAAMFERPTFAADPITVDGYDHFDIALSQPAEGGSFTVADIVVGRKLRLYLVYGYNEPGYTFWTEYHGLSDAFEVIPGGVTDVAIELYFFC